MQTNVSFPRFPTIRPLATVSRKIASTQLPQPCHISRSSVLILSLFFCSQAVGFFLFLSGFPIEIVHMFLVSPVLATWTSISSSRRSSGWCLTFITNYEASTYVIFSSVGSSRLSWVQTLCLASRSRMSSFYFLMHYVRTPNLILT